MRAPTRRQVLAAIVLAPAALGAGGCSLLPDDRPDPLRALADQARTDVALATAVAAANGGLAARVEPVRAARAAHAAALDAEVARRAGAAPAAAQPAVPGAAAAATIAGLRDALADSAQAAAAAALRLPADRVGLVASVAACCGAYAEMLV